MTRPACATNSSVSAPFPGPTSKTTESFVRRAAAIIFRTILPSIKKFCPRWRLGKNPPFTIDIDIICDNLIDASMVIHYGPFYLGVAERSLFGAFFCYTQFGWAWARGAYDSMLALTSSEAGLSPAGSIHLKNYLSRNCDRLVLFSAQGQITERRARIRRRGTGREKKHMPSVR